MNHLIRAELLKLRTTRMLYVNAVAALAFVPLSVANSILSAGDPGAGPALTTSEGLRNVISAGSSGSLVILMLGVLIMAGEFRHNTATSTFLISPDRSQVVRAKLIAASIVGVVLALAASVLTLAIALPWLASRDIDVDVLSGDVAAVLLGGIVGDRPVRTGRCRNRLNGAEPDGSHRRCRGVGAGRRRTSRELRSRRRALAARRCSLRPLRRGDCQRWAAADVGRGAAAHRSTGWPSPPPAPGSSSRGTSREPAPRSSTRGHTHVRIQDSHPTR